MVSGSMVQEPLSSQSETRRASLFCRFGLCEDCGGFWRQVTRSWSHKRYDSLALTSPGCQIWTCGTCKGEWQTQQVPEGIQRGCKGRKLVKGEALRFVGGRISHRGISAVRTCMVDWPRMRTITKFVLLERSHFLGCSEDSGHPDWSARQPVLGGEWSVPTGFWGVQTPMPQPRKALSDTKATRMYEEHLSLAAFSREVPFLV